MNIDVLICGHNEAAHVSRTIASLRAQSVSSSRFRVIFVDNASTDETRKVVDENARELELRYIYESRLGKNIAINSGLAVSSADYVAFLDADACAHPSWIEEILRVIADYSPELCGGPYFPYYIAPKPAWYLDRYNTSYQGAVARYLTDSEYLNGANMIWQKSLLDKLGGFRVGVGLAGRGLVRGDETELIVRARQSDPEFKAYYDPRIIVEHLTRPETYSLWYWTRRHFAHGRSMRQTFGARESLRNNPIRVLWRSILTSGWLFLAAAKGLLWRDVKQYPRYQNYLYEVVLPRLGSLGNLSAYLLPVRSPSIPV